LVGFGLNYINVNNKIQQILMKKKTIIITGGAGFVGANLIELLLKKTKYKIISLDNYSSGNKKNHIKNKRVRYIKGHTKNISNLIKDIRNINCVFHFGEFARIYQSFLNMSECIESNTVGTNSVFNFCLENKIKLIYSATSATLGNQGNDKNLSPYAFTKSKNLELLENLKKWFKFKYEVIYFYNVYGPRQISKGKMSTVIGIFEEAFKKNKPLSVVRPGSQTRRFTHIYDTVEVCYQAWKKNLCRHYSIASKESFSILEVAKLFDHKIIYLRKRAGERYASALTNMNLSNKVYKYFGKIKLKNYINRIISSS
jgi:UDP-glucose 4-epimerase